MPPAEATGAAIGGPGGDSPRPSVQADGGAPPTTRAHRLPIATYRLQLRREFPLEAADAALPYLRLLGVSDLYLSPIYAAREGSIHGYDIIDHGRLNPELGDAKALRQLLDDTAGAGLGVILDIVPNHMCVAGDQNRLWMDVLESGRHSPCAGHFDIDWDPPKPELVGKVLLPFLGEQYGRVLEGGIQVRFQDGAFSAVCEGSRLPLCLGSWRLVLEPALETLRGRVAAEAPALIELESILRAVAHAVPILGADSAESAVEYRHEKEAIQRRLATLTGDYPAAAAAIATAVSALNGTTGDPASFDAIERVMDHQHYRLANWRVAAHEINYRRFFDVNELAAIRVERPEVFADVHALPFEIAVHAAFTGFRIDHVDGLSDPEQYLIDLRDGSNRVRPLPPGERPYIVVEKILGMGEELPASWDVDGTTGYEFAQLASEVFVKPGGGIRLRAVGGHFAAGGASGGLQSFADTAYDCKRLLLKTTLAAELTVLARRLDRVSEQHRYTRDFTLNHLQEALTEVLACFPVYRTYIRHDERELSERDAAVIAQAISCARRKNPVINSSLFDFIASVLLRREPPGLQPAQIDERRTFETRFQQLTGPVCAKGVEDTAFYRYLPLLALNEVGGDPSTFGASDAEIHRALARRREVTPHTLSATATHDTKRGEDTRARLYVLSEVADAWALVTDQWVGLNAEHKTKIDGAAAPDAAEEYVLYQSLVGTWPLGGWESEPEYPQRIRQYMAKARHEAKTNTSWINPNEAYDRAADAFLEAVLDPVRSGAFLASVDRFTRTIMRPGMWNGLGQLVLKLCAPGIPDFFQGCELWDFSLVDPDNRKLVDFRHRRALLSALLEEGGRTSGATPPGRASSPVAPTGPTVFDGWFAAPEDGRVKLWVTATGLRVRRERREIFESGDYQPLTVVGPAAEHVFAFARVHGGQAVVAVVGRFLATLGAEVPTGEIWKENRLALPDALAGRQLRNVLTETTLPPGDKGLSLSDVFRHFPFAILETTP